MLDALLQDTGFLALGKKAAQPLPAWRYLLSCSVSLHVQMHDTPQNFPLL